MIALILLVVFGLGAALFATQNTGVVHITLANYLFSGIPLYVIVIGSMLVGIFISWLISMIDSISSTITIHGKDNALKEAHQTIEKYKKENQALLMENEHLKGEREADMVIEENRNEAASPQPSFFHRIKHSFS